MSLNYLPWPIYVLFAFTSAFVLFNFTRKVWSLEPNKILLIGMDLIGVTGLGVGISKLGKTFKPSLDIWETILFITALITFLAIILLIIGGLMKVKKGEVVPGKKKSVLFSAGMLIFLMIALATLYIWACYFKN